MPWGAQRDQSPQQLATGASVVEILCLIRSFVDSVHPAAELRVDLIGGTVCCSRDNPGIGGEGEWNPGNVVHPQACGHGDRHDLDDLDGTLPYDMAAENLARQAVDYQLAESDRPAVNDRARGLVEAHHDHYYLVSLASLRFA